MKRSLKRTLIALSIGTASGAYLAYAYYRKKNPTGKDVYRAIYNALSEQGHLAGLWLDYTPSYTQEGTPIYRGGCTLQEDTGTKRYTFTTPPPPELMLVLTPED